MNCMVRILKEKTTLGVMALLMLFFGLVTPVAAQTPAEQSSPPAGSRLLPSRPQPCFLKPLSTSIPYWKALQ